MLKKELTTKQKFLKQFSEFLQTNKTVAIIFLSAVIAFIIIFAVISEINKSIEEKSTGMAELIQEDFDSWTKEGDEEMKSSLESSILEQVEAVLEKYPKTYGGQRVLFIRGNLYFNKEEWDSAHDDYLLLAERFPKSYLAVVALINGAVSMEESGRPEKALEIYHSILTTYREETPEIPRVLFAAGRIQELLGEEDSALDTYNDLLDNFSSSSWTNLVRNRIIYLE